MKAGDRVGAILKADFETVYFLGFGVFDGDQELPEEMAIFKGQKNPRLTLDNGNQVWGMQCWWGSEDAIKKKFAGRKIVNVNIDNTREIT